MTTRLAAARQTGLVALTGSTLLAGCAAKAKGGAAGAIIGSRMDKQAKDLEQDINGATIERVGEGIEATYPGTDLVIVGTTDQLGSAEYNQSLSE